MLYLRARYYSPNDGRFQSRDTWGGDYNSPMSLNRWNYTQSNPINYTDPSGNSPIGTSQILAQALPKYSGLSGNINILALIDCPPGGHPRNPIYVILICGVGDTEGCGVPGKSLSPYKTWAVSKGYKPVTYDVDACDGSKYICVDRIKQKWIDKHPNTSFYFIGHSAGADVAIAVASYMITSGREKHIKGVVLLDPTVTWSPTGLGSGVSLKDELSKMTGLPVFIGASTSGDEKDNLYNQGKSPNEILENYFNGNFHKYTDQGLNADPNSSDPFNTPHYKLSQDMNVYNDAVSFLR